MSIPSNYRVTPEDVDRGWKLFARSFGVGDGPEPTEEELYIAHVLMDAGHIYRKTGKWPTVKEVVAQQQRENEEYWMTRFGKLPPQ